MIRAWGAAGSAVLAGTASRPSAVAWPNRTRRFRGLGHDFAVRTEVDVLAAHLDRLYGAMACDGVPSLWYTITADVASDVPGRFCLFVDDDLIRGSSSPSATLETLIWHVNRQVVARSRHLVRIHAAGLASGDRAVLLPAPMASGKTTTATALLRAGLDYLTDETVAIDPSSGRVLAYPKPLSIKEGSHQVLAGLDPHYPPEVGVWTGRRWQVPPTEVGGGHVVTSALPRLLVAPTYQTGAHTRLEPIRRAEAVRLLVENAFDFTVDPRRDLAVLADTVRRCDTYRLTVGDLDEACRLVLDLLEDVEAIRD